MGIFRKIHAAGVLVFFSVLSACYSLHKNKKKESVKPEAKELSENINSGGIPEKGMALWWNTASELPGEYQKVRKKFYRQSLEEWSPATARKYAGILKKLYEQSLDLASGPVWRMQAYLLDDLDEVYQSFREKGSGYEDLLIRFDRLPVYFGGVRGKEYLKENPLKIYSPLIRLESLSVFKDEKSWLEKKFSSDHEFLGELAGAGAVIEREVIAMERLLKWSHNPDNIAGNVLTAKWSLGIFTGILSQLYNRPLGHKSRLSASGSIASFALSVKISPGEPLRLTREGPYYLRGCRFLFGKSHDGYGSKNLFFIRELTDEARRLYFLDFDQIPRDPEGTVPALVASAADSRLSVNLLESGHADREISVFGKIVSRKAQAMTENADSELRHLSTRYPMTLRELLAVPEYYQKPPEKKSGKGTVSAEEIIRGAQTDLLTALYLDLKNSDSGIYVVKQRLATSDGHNFRIPHNGEVLSHLQLAELLKERAMKRSPGAASFRAGFTGLEKVFQEQEASLGRSSLSTLEILGSSIRAVSETAVSQNPSILAQNSRKISVLRYGNSYSVHVFIDAVGVSKVFTWPVSGRKVQTGDRYGNMQFGHDYYGRNEGFETLPYRFTSGSQLIEFKESSYNSTRDGLKKINPGKKSYGELWGRFSENGSTVISLYFQKDFQLIPQIRRYYTVMNTLLAKRSIGRIPEIKVQAGHGILRRR